MAHFVRFIAIALLAVNYMHAQEATDKAESIFSNWQLWIDNKNETYRVVWKIDTFRDGKLSDSIERDNQSAADCALLSVKVRENNPENVFEDVLIANRLYFASLRKKENGVWYPQMVELAPSSEYVDRSSSLSYYGFRVSVFGDFRFREIDLTDYDVRLNRDNWTLDLELKGVPKSPQTAKRIHCILNDFYPNLPKEVVVESGENEFRTTRTSTTIWDEDRAMVLPYRIESITFRQGKELFKSVEEVIQIDRQSSLDPNKCFLKFYGIAEPSTPSRWPGWIWASAVLLLAGFGVYLVSRASKKP